MIYCYPPNNFDQLKHLLIIMVLHFVDPRTIGKPLHNSFVTIFIFLLEWAKGGIVRW